MKKNYNLLHKTEVKTQLLNKIAKYDTTLNNSIVKEMQRVLNIIDLIEVKHLNVSEIGGYTVGIIIGVDADE